MVRGTVGKGFPTYGDLKSEFRGQFTQLALGPQGQVSLGPTTSPLAIAASIRRPRCPMDGRFANEIKIIGVVGIVEERPLPTVAALSDVMGKTAYDGPCHPGHDSTPWLCLPALGKAP